ncbi:hypothetical protein L861_15025 [Litchfieldella anticariensis FP35 = DSM 16096]|uniref:N-acetyltransferase domain-containing protein n=1 Tax=Litchfieldella anticariensis (strain DSM 16096 / CECT 5854 / CIP 108499 / LMG 22089 / FP35) TaxID=1121939 RepID=S2KJR1_LITA3|nr:GNAT family protein [Halomonas anticariensis]EPC02347.1 hypothetical protein L861_15025 [Halomonas anticariensis FP35 = DSM 16096]
MNEVLFQPTMFDDLDFVLIAEGAPDSSPFITPWDAPRHCQAMADPDIAHRMVWSGGKPVGFFILAGLSSPHRSLELRRVVAAEKGIGFGRRIVREVKRLAFTELGMHRLWLDVKVDNGRARQLYRSEGFIEEGMLRECLEGPSGYESLVVMSMLSHEFEAAYSPRAF